MRYWVYSVLLSGLLCALCVGCAAPERKPELIGVQPAPTQRTYPTAAPARATLPLTPTRRPITVTATTDQPQPSDTAAPTQAALVPVVVIVQPVPAGYAIPPEAVAVLLWPPDSAPVGRFESVEQVINEVTLVDLPCFEPVIRASVARRQVGAGFRELSDSCPPIPQTVQTDVVVAVRDIRAGERITPAMVRLAGWPYAPADAAIVLTDVIGTRALTAIYREQVLTSARLTDTE